MIYESYALKPWEVIRNIADWEARRLGYERVCTEEIAPAETERGGQYPTIGEPVTRGIEYKPRGLAGILFRTVVEYNREDGIVRIYPKIRGIGVEYPLSRPWFISRPAHQIWQELVLSDAAEPVEWTQD